MEMPHLQKFAEAKDKVFELQKLRLMTMIGDSVSKRRRRDYRDSRARTMLVLLYPTWKRRPGSLSM